MGTMPVGMKETDPEYHVLQSYDVVMQELRALTVEKIGTYGLNRYDPNDAVFNLVRTYFDCDRKLQRLRHMSMLAIKLNIVAPANFRREFRDLANYGIIGVQITDLMEGHRL